MKVENHNPSFKGIKLGFNKADGIKAEKFLKNEFYKSVFLAKLETNDKWTKFPLGFINDIRKDLKNNPFDIIIGHMKLSKSPVKRLFETKKLVIAIRTPEKEIIEAERFNKNIFIADSTELIDEKAGKHRPLSDCLKLTAKEHVMPAFYMQLQAKAKRVMKLLKDISPNEH